VQEDILFGILEGQLKMLNAVLAQEIAVHAT